MTNITQLPDSFERQWRAYEAKLRAAFEDKTDASSDEVGYAMAQLKPIYMRAARFDFTPTEGVSGNVVLRELNEWVRQQVMDLMTHVALRDCELYRLRGDE